MPPSVRLDVAASQRWLCAVCKAILSAVYEIDHRVPLHRGGTDTFDNLQALCPNCHRVKSRREAQDLYASTRRYAPLAPEIVVSPYFGTVGEQQPSPSSLAMPVCPPFFAARKDWLL